MPDTNGVSHMVNRLMVAQESSNDRSHELKIGSSRGSEVPSGSLSQTRSNSKGNAYKRDKKSSVAKSRHTTNGGQSIESEPKQFNQKSIDDMEF